MSPLSERLRKVALHADLQLEFAGRRAQIVVRRRDVVVEVPDVATGLVFFRSVLPRGLRGRAARTFPTLGFSFQLRVRGRSVLEAAQGKSGFLAWLGLPHVRVHPVAVTLAAAGR